ncbi:MAG: hypothetical protein LBC99_00870 [Spirochaetota bacterium]|nr:hypothetical protein [Spirochaetota bacterium]
MKKFMQVVLIGMIAASLLGFAGCSKAGDPKALAKQVYEKTQEMMAAMLSGNSDAGEKMMKESEGLQKKIEALSDSDKKIFQEELARLMGDAYNAADDSDDEEEDAEDTEE